MTVKEYEIYLHGGPRDGETIKLLDLPPVFYTHVPLPSFQCYETEKPRVHKYNRNQGRHYKYAGVDK